MCSPTLRRPSHTSPPGWMAKPTLPESATCGLADRKPQVDSSCQPALALSGSPAVWLVPDERGESDQFTIHRQEVLAMLESKPADAVLFALPTLKDVRQAWNWRRLWL